VLTAISAAARGGGQAKIDVCHADGKDDYRLISVAEAAYQTHLDHGDATIGDFVPGTDESKVFDETCQIIDAPVTGPTVTEGAPNYDKAGQARWKGTNSGGELYVGQMTTSSTTPRVESNVNWADGTYPVSLARPGCLRPARCRRSRRQRCGWQERRPRRAVAALAERRGSLVRLLREDTAELPRECQAVPRQGHGLWLGVAMTPVSTNATAAQPRWLSAVTGWLPTPADADFDARRAHAIGQLAPVGLVIHALYVPLFAWWGVWPLSAYNVLSTAVFALVMLMARRGQVQRALSLAGAEVFVHALLAVLLIGWGFGGQYYLLLYMVFVFAFPYRRAFQFTVLAATIALFVSGYYYTQGTAPRFEIPSAPLAVLNALNISAVFACVAFAVSYTMGVAGRAEKALAAEHARSERLLTNVLPVPIAERLKAREEVIADGVDGASVLFADIVGFTVLSSQRSPDEVVAMLNGVFTRLDGLVDAFGLEKIKTIGDAYMVASGIPTPREDHAQVLARFALAARDELAEHNLTADVPVELRIGINSGPVVAGVIGRRRFLYDLWGDTVNTASRMESHGIPGQIQITETTRALLDGEFTCTERGVVDVKGKGPTRTWLLEAEAVAAPA